MVRRRPKRHHIRRVALAAPCGPAEFLHRIHQCGCWCGNDLHLSADCVCCSGCGDLDCPGCVPAAVGDPVTEA